MTHSYASSPYPMHQQPAGHLSMGAAPDYAAMGMAMPMLSCTAKQLALDEQGLYWCCCECTHAYASDQGNA